MKKPNLLVVLCLASLVTSAAPAIASSCSSHARPIPLGVCGSSVRSFSSGLSEVFANPISTVLADFGVTMAEAGGGAEPNTQLAPSDEELEAEAVANKYGPELVTIPGVWGVGAYMYPDGHMYIKVMVEAFTLEIQNSIPSTLGGFPVVIKVGPRATFLVDPKSCPKGRSSK